MEEEKKEQNVIADDFDGSTDDELIEEVDNSQDDAPVAIIYRCKKCHQILDENAKDCWRCSSKEIERVVEEETKELQKVMLQAKIAKLEKEVKTLKSNNNFIYVMLFVIVAFLIIRLFV